MKTPLLQLIFLLFTFPLFAQPVNKLGGKTTAQFGVLSDENYSLENIISNKNLPFKVTDSLVNANAYWLRLITYNSEAYTEKYILSAYPNLNTQLYFFDREELKWRRHSSGIKDNDKPWLKGRHPYQIKALTFDTLYIRIDVSGPNLVNSRFKARVEIVPEVMQTKKQQNMKTAWLVGFIVLLLFFFNNLCIYFVLRDKTIRYYLAIQLGAMLYLTSYWFLFDFGGTYVFSYVLVNEFLFYEFNKLFTHIAIIIIFIGLVQLTRTYLNTRKYLPLEDRLLKYALNTYVFLSVLLMIINTSGFLLDYYTIKYDNLYCALLILLIIFTSMKAYVKKIPLSEPYLLANLLPFIFIFSIPIYHLFVSTTSGDNYLLPVFAVVSQALGFSVALLTRTQTLEKALKVREMESQQIAFSMKEISYLNKLNEMEIEQMDAAMALEKNRNEMLLQNLALNQRELASAALNMVQKSELLTLLKDQIRKLNWMDRYHTKKNVEKLDHLLESNIQLDSDWSNFKLHFEHVHPNFFENLKKDHPNLTVREIRLYAYFEMNLSHKEIAALLDIDPASVRRAKTRLLKKMGKGLSQ